MDIKGKGERIWRKEIDGKNGKFYAYSVSSSYKNEDGSYDNAYISVKFSQKSGAPKKIPNGAKCDFEGFMSARKRRNADGKEFVEPMIMVMKARFEDDIPDDDFEDVDSFELMESDIPF